MQLEKRQTLENKLSACRSSLFNVREVSGYTCTAGGLFQSCPAKILSVTSHLNVVGLPSDSDGNADIAKQIPPNPLQHLNFEENVEAQKDHKIEPDQINIPKSRVSDLQKIKQSKLASITHFNILKKPIHFFICVSACLENRDHCRGWLWRGSLRMNIMCSWVKDTL